MRASVGFDKVVRILMVTLGAAWACRLFERLARQ
jgi:hypothetical protein